MKVKICGITQLEDGLVAAREGADMLGFNFYPPSPRCIPAERCLEIAGALRDAFPGLKLVGVFVNTGPDDILKILETCRLDAAQLTGEEMSVRAAAAALGPRAFPAVRLPAPAGTLAALSPRLAAGEAGSDDLPALLVDAHQPGAYGGTGKLADWGQAAVLAARHSILLAGGLTPDNVRAGIERVQPWGVDVASGVESAPGIKDHEKVRLFIMNAKNTGLRAIH